MNVGYWLPAPDPQLGESWPLEQVHMLGLEQKPSPHEFLQIAGGRYGRAGQICLFIHIWQQQMTQGHPTHSTQKKALTNNALVPSRQGLPAWAAVGVEAWSTHIRPVETRQTEQTNSLVTQTPQTCLSVSPKQIHKLTRCSQRCQRPAWPHDKHNQLWYKNLSDDGWWYFQREERRKEMWGVGNNMRNPILFSLKAERKLGRTGCIKSHFLQNSDT